MSIGFGRSFPPAGRASEQVNSSTSMTISMSSQSLNLPPEMNESQIDEILQHEQIMNLFLNKMLKQFEDWKEGLKTEIRGEFNTRIQNLESVLVSKNNLLVLKEDLIKAKDDVFQPFYFETRKTNFKILGSVDERVEKIVTWLLEHPDIKLTLNGFADNRGNDEHNKILGKARAEFVKTLLCSDNRLNASRLTIISCGKTTKFDPNSLPPNRQVQFVYGDSESTPF